MNADNIVVYPIQTDDISVWVDEAVACFEKLHQPQPYDAFMTRSTPPESILVAEKIREKYPDIPWIASIADPIGKSPYDIKGLLLESTELSEEDKTNFQLALHVGCERWKTHENAGIRSMCAIKDIEDYAIDNAEVLVFPHEIMKNYVLGTRRRKNTLVVPHTFDRSLYPPLEAGADSPITLTFLGHSEPARSLEPIVRALDYLQKRNPGILKNLRVRFVGHTTEYVRALINNYFLYNTISVESTVDYLTSLALMQESDWLIHIDANFPFLRDTGGSVYFAGKLADYMGTEVPILALTGRHSPADEIIRKAGGLSCDQDDIAGIAEVFEAIAEGNIVSVINRVYRDTYDATQVAAAYDHTLEAALNTEIQPFTREYWPVVSSSGHAGEKFLSICIPAYNVECYLDRCLYSLVSSPVADTLEILIVNDGSCDATPEIARAYEEHYPSLITLINKENGGHGSTINAALAKASGTYFRVLDGDDWIDSENLALMITKMLDEGLLPDLVSSNYHQISVNSGEALNWQKISGAKDYQVFNFADEDFSMEYFTMASTMIKTELLRGADFSLQENTFYVDVEYILFPIPLVNTVMFTPEFIYRYAVGSVDQSINPDVFAKRYEHHDRVIRRMLEYHQDNMPTMSKGQILYTDSLFKRHLLKSHYQLSLIWDPDKERGLARAKEFDSYLKNLNPEFYESVGSEYRAVREAREKDFNPKLIAEFASMEEGSAEPPVKRRVKLALRGIVERVMND